MYRELQELNVLKDFFKLRVQFLKQKIVIQEKDNQELEKSYIRERDHKEKAQKRMHKLDQRMFESQAELVSHREKSEKYEGERRHLHRQLKDLEYRFEDTT